MTDMTVLVLCKGGGTHVLILWLLAKYTAYFSQ